MKRTHLIFSIILFSAIIPMLYARGNDEGTQADSLVIYCYDSFSSEWGPGPIISEGFTAATGIEIEFHAPGDAITVLNQLILEKDAPRADVVVGLDDSLLERARSEGILQSYSSDALKNLPEDLIFDAGHFLLPYDYGHFAINYDSVALESPPSSLEELTEERYKDQLILMDPRTSTPGLGFLLWTVAVYGDEWEDYWQRLEPSILTIADGWSQGYSLYTAGEAPLVLSYGTSPVYHAEYEGSDRYKAASFQEGHVMQIEGMGIVAGSKNVEAAKLFVDYMLDLEAQKAIAMTNIMLPVNPDLELPESFDMALRPSKTVDIEGIRSRKDIDDIIESWVEVFAR